MSLPPGHIPPPGYKIVSPEPIAEVDVLGAPIVKYDFALPAGWDAASPADKRAYQLKQQKQAMQSRERAADAAFIPPAGWDKASPEARLTYRRQWDRDQAAQKR
ncbi:MAG: hypothetical protein WDN46_10740 [Methylocella sp.]